MNSLRLLQRVPKLARPMPVVAKRSMASAPKTATGYRPKTFYEAWCSDVGAYPVMSVIGFAVIFSGSACFYFLFTHPDSRFSKSSRTKIFRGNVE